MAVEEIRQDIRLVEQIVDDMDLFDDDLMSMVFDGNHPATGLLEDGRLCVKRLKNMEIGGH